MRIQAIGLALVLAAAAAVGQPFTVLLNNPEEAVFHFVLDPPELGSFDPASSVFANVVYDYFAEGPAAGQASFQSLTAGSTRRLDGLAEGTHLLVGFFALPGRRDFPVRALMLKAGGGLAERFYSVYTEPSLLKARAGRGRLAAFAAAAPAAPAPAPAAAPRDPARGELGIRIDGDFADWEAIPVLRSFTDYRPRTFTRERIGSGRLELPLEQSRYWQKGGTALSELKLVDNGSSLYLFLSTRSAMAEGLSLYLYFRNLRDPEGENRVTVELLPAAGEKPGLAALWVRERAPAAVGVLASQGFFLEASLDKAAIYGALASPPAEAWLELTAGFHDRSALAYEEFYYLKLALPEVPTPDTLYGAKD
jgi:hypothetical protein